MGKITKVPNGPLIKKKGPYAGSTLKTGGTIKKAQTGKRVTRWMTDEEYKKSTDSLSKNSKKIDPGFSISPKQSGKTTDPGFMKTPSNYDPNTKRKRVTSEDGMLQYLKNGNKIKKAMVGTGIFKNNPITKKANAVRGLVGKAYGLPGKVIVKNGGNIKKAKNGDPPKPNYSNMKTTKRSFFKDKPYTPTAIDSSYYRQGFDMALGGKSSIPAYDMKTNQGLRGYEEATKRGLNPKKKPRAKAGAMIKRADGSMSRRGLWDNIRANKGSGKKPTKQMLVQEKKIKAKTKK